MKTVYLIGALSEDPATHKWREEAIGLLEGFNIINAAASSFDRTLLQKARGDPIAFYKWVKRSKNNELLLPKSYQATEKSDIVFANLAIEPVGRPLIGTIFEIAWGWSLHKPIIAIRGQEYYCQHPILKASVHAFVDSVPEGCEAIKEFFGED